jgi:hypothetical protein
LPETVCDAYGTPFPQPASAELILAAFAGLFADAGFFAVFSAHIVSSRLGHIFGTAATAMRQEQSVIWTGDEHPALKADFGRIRRGKNRERA